MWNVFYGYTFLVCCVASYLISVYVKPWAIWWNYVDQPGGRKQHEVPTPLLGGVALFASVWIFLWVHLFLFLSVSPLLPPWGWDPLQAAASANRSMDRVIGVFLGCSLLFLVGLWDDRRPVGPFVKLVFQILAAVLSVASGCRMTLFIHAPWVGALFTVIWIVAMTNAMNWLDHMDGLAASIALIAGVLFWLVAQATGQTFTAVLAVAVAGASLGFLPHNFPRASMFMGDAGSLCLGFLLANIAVVGTFYQASYPTMVSALSPVLILSVPLFDMAVVLWIRWRNGQALWEGDRNHFTHRLVRLGMSETRAVLLVCLVALSVGSGAVLFRYVSWRGALLLLAQAGAMFSIIAILMAIPERRKTGGNTCLEEE